MRAAASEAADPAVAPGTADTGKDSLSSHRFVLFRRVVLGDLAAVSAGAVLVIGGLWLLGEHLSIPQLSSPLRPPSQSEAPPQTPAQAPAQFTSAVASTGPAVVSARQTPPRREKPVARVSSITVTPARSAAERNAIVV